MKWLTVKQAGEYLGVSNKSIYKLISNGLLPCYRPVGMSIRISIEALDEYVKSGLIQSSIEIKTIAEKYLQNIKGSEPF